MNSKSQPPVRVGRHTQRHGMSLIEVIAAVSLVAMASVATVVGLVQPSDRAKAAACGLTRMRIEVEARSMQRETGNWPTMAELMRDRKRFPEPELTCPVNGQTYRLHPADHTVHGHDH